MLARSLASSQHIANKTICRGSIKNAAVRYASSGADGIRNLIQETSPSSERSDVLEDSAPTNSMSLSKRLQMKLQPESKDDGAPSKPTLRSASTSPSKDSLDHASQRDALEHDFQEHHNYVMSKRKPAREFTQGKKNTQFGSENEFSASKSARGYTKSPIQSPSSQNRFMKASSSKTSVNSTNSNRSRRPTRRRNIDGEEEEQTEELVELDQRMFGTQEDWQVLHDLTVWRNPVDAPLGEPAVFATMHTGYDLVANERSTFLRKSPLLSPAFGVDRNSGQLPEGWGNYSPYLSSSTKSLAGTDVAALAPQDVVSVGLARSQDISPQQRDTVISTIRSIVDRSRGAQSRTTG